MLQKINTEMNEAYKLVSGDPSIDAVSRAAQGQMPLSDKEKRMKDFMVDEKCLDINEAYAMLFESLSIIARSKSPSV